MASQVRKRARVSLMNNSFMPCAHSGRVPGRSSALYTACRSLPWLCVQPAKQLANSERVVGTQDFLRQRSKFRQAGGQHALFDAGYLRRKHRELAQTETQQQAGVGQFTGNFAAYRNRHAEPVASADDMRQQMQDGGMQRIVKMRDFFVGAIDRQRVLN